MTFLYLLIVVIVIAGLLAISKSAKGKHRSVYYSKEVLGKAEQVAYWRLVEAYRDEKVVLSQVAFSAFLKTSGVNKKENLRLFAIARQKVADIVICNKDFSIYAILEIDDKTHVGAKDEARDKILMSADIKTFRVEAWEIPSGEQLRRVIDDECLRIS